MAEHYQTLNSNCGNRRGGGGGDGGGGGRRSDSRDLETEMPHLLYALCYTR